VSLVVFIALIAIWFRQYSFELFEDLLKSCS